MAAPTPTPRVTPSGIKLKDGFPTKITFSTDTNLEIWEKTVQPPGISNGDPIEQTTMHNDDWETFAPQALNSLTESGGTAAYDPGCLTAIQAMCGLEQTITYTFPDGTTWAVYGYLVEFIPDSLERGSQPEASFRIQPTNWDNVNKVEAGPAVASVAGT